MKKEKKGKIIIAWIVLILLIIMLLVLNYIKFFGSQTTPNIEEKPVGNSSEQAVNNALQQIVDNFNQHEKVKEYAEQNIGLKAVLNGYSIYISYTTDTTTTYEFTYHDLTLDIDIANDEENIQKFKTIYEILIYAVQQRIDNDENIDSYVSEFLNDSEEYDGLYKVVADNIISYHMDITRKLKANDSSEIQPDMEEQPQEQSEQEE